VTNQFPITFTITLLMSPKAADQPAKPALIARITFFSF